MESLPIACSLTDAELLQRRQTLLLKVRGAVVEVRELADGYAYQLPGDEEWLATIASMINLERQCCPFLTFQMTVEPGGGPVWLALTGPGGTKEFLSSTFS